MRIKITKGGIHGADGEILVGTELTVNAEPTGWAGRYEVISGRADDKTEVLNPALADPLKAELEAKTVPELKELATTEKVDLKGATAKGDIITHILDARVKAAV